MKIIKIIFTFFLITTFISVAYAQEPDPSIYLLMDTSGSMLMTIDGSQNTYGDGSTEHPHVTGTVSRFYTAKEAIKTILSSYGEVRWGLARFEQRSGFNYICMCSDEIPNNATGCSGYGGLWAPEDDCRLCDLMSDYPDYDIPGEHDRVCINYSSGILDGCIDPISGDEMKSADILVPAGSGTSSEIALWVNHNETDEGEAGFNGALTPEQQPDPELRAVGGTPIGGSLQKIYDQLANHDLGNDPLRGCRPYTVIVLTDGAESCGTDPVSVATELLDVPDLQHDCGTGCPTNSYCDGSHCRYQVKTYVIAFAVAPNEFVNCNEIAVAGGTQAAISAQNTADLVAAMSGIIADSIITERCNGIDDNCDGTIDEDFAELGTTCNNGLLGICYGHGNYICTMDGSGTECDMTSPGSPPTIEICNGLDDDCNGIIDDVIGGCPTPTPEICNGNDDDLDGTTTDDGDDDPAVGQPCGNSLGICLPGITVCQGGVVVCNTTNPPQTETCNNLDDDCDGLVDENLTDTCFNSNGAGTCSGLSYCSEGAWICTARTPEVESCNNYDDNCDGSIDENLSRQCQISNGYGICYGSETCSTGIWSGCDALTPSLDICNGIDDDCDGDIDDSDPAVGQPCQGGCGVYVCEEGVLTCTGETSVPETCNAVDDDCDGLIDEDLSQNCEKTNEYGTCTGLEFCANGFWGGCSAQEPGPEECNGLDDNCDGLIDNEAVCPDQNDVCFEGKCRSQCGSGEFVCDSTEECVEYEEDTSISICMPILKECGDTICNTSQVCVSGECINPCEPNPCGELETCKVNFRWDEGDPIEQQYSCIDSSCATVGNTCSSEQFCWEGYCVNDPCEELNCEIMEFCTRSFDGTTWTATCEGVCNCPSGSRCDSEGQCTVDSCHEVECGYGKICEEGQCLDDPCLSTICRAGEKCYDGTCEWDPCYGVECPAWAMCSVTVEKTPVCIPRPENVVDPIEKGKISAGGGCSQGNKTDSGLLLILFITGLFAIIRKSRNVLPIASILLISFVFTSCDREIYTIREDGSVNTDVTNNGNPDAGEDADSCIVSEEICDEQDNDCNGIVDDYWAPISEGGQGHFDDDPANCGSCDNICAYINARAICVNGQCALGECDPYFFDLNGNPSDGCEYRCTTLGGEDEICDGLDNDCDGLVDEYWIPVSEGGEGHFMDDPENCGFCGVDCTGLYPHGIGGCSEGLCVLENCEHGWINANGFMSDGCETECIPSNGGVEICDNIDNDCNGFVDDDGSGQPLSQPCYNGPVGTEGVGQCIGGLSFCTGGVYSLTCSGEVLPVSEQCNGVDDNCDGNNDDGFDTDTDINNCGSCGHSCLTTAPPANSYAVSCLGGACVYVCSYGFHDLNGDLNSGAGNGCEYACEPTASIGVEYCDGNDNDCDGDIDEASDLVAPPVGYCKTGGACGTTVSSVCQSFGGNVQWVCNYPSDVERVSGSPNLVNSRETLCDGFDGDCDGSIDEDFYPVLGTACTDSNPGACQGSGNYVCKADMSGTECHITSSGTPTAEICDGIDNDCDGLTDEAAWNPGSNPSYVNDDVVTITTSTGTVDIYRYEASRPLATVLDAGSSNSVRACSRSGVLPWSKVTYEQARLACQKAGMDLCSASDWEESCNGSGVSWIYPYHASTFNASTCNGEGAGVGQVSPTGQFSSCISSGYGINDLSGNLREWTKTIVSYNSAGKVIYQLRGGSYRDGSESLKCAYDTVGLVEDAFTSNVGFRCCTRCGNGLLDPGEQCDDGNRDGGDGCSPICGKETCGNGVVDSGEECDCGLNSLSIPAACTDINGASNSNCSLNCTIPEERCSSLYPGDQNRGGEVTDCLDPDCAATWCEDVTDNDGDGFAEPEDCDDTNPLVNPAMDEVCGNGIDDNCNGFTDDDEPDKDGDGQLRCVGGVEMDCNDWNSEITPDAPEICGDGIDNNCDGLTDTLCASECELAAWNRSYLGCEYFAVSTMNSLLGATFDNNFAIVVYNPNSTPANVTVTKGSTTHFNANIAAQSVQNITLPFDATLKNGTASIQTVANGAYRVVSNIPIAVYQFNPFDFRIGSNYSYTNDASLLIPKHALTNNYMVHTLSTWAGAYPGFFAVVGTSNGTQIRVNYNGHAQSGQNMGTSQTYNLEMGSVLQVPSRTGCTASVENMCTTDYDLTGTTIEVLTGDPVAVFAGHNCVDVPGNITWCDHVEEQMMPLETWGKTYIAAYTAPYQGTTSVMNRYRILAAEDNTTVSFNPTSVQSTVVLNAGEYVQFNSAINFTISADKPVSVMEFMLGQAFFAGATTGDPAKGTLVPMEQYRKDYAFSVPSSMTTNYVTIIKPVAMGGLNAPAVTINGDIIPEASFSTAIGLSYHGVARINLTTSYPGIYSFNLSSTQPFGIIVYGNAAYTTYIYPGGLDLNIINSAE